MIQALLRRRRRNTKKAKEPEDTNGNTIEQPEANPNDVSISDAETKKC